MEFSSFPLPFQSMITYLMIIVSLLAIYVYLNLKTRKSRTSNLKEIPTEKGLPIIGVVNNIKEPLFKYLFKLSEKYGPIYQVRFGMRNVVVLGSFEYLKAAFIDLGEAFSGRWKAENNIFVANKAGLFFIDGKVWAEQRSFVAKTLREYGVGRSRSVEIVQDECAHMLEDLDNMKGQSGDLSDILTLYSVNAILKFVMNKRFSRGDVEMKVLQKYTATLVTENDPLAKFLIMFPFIESHEWLIEFIIWVTSRKSLGDDFHRLIEKEIKEHSDRLDFNSEGDDLIDKFLIKQRREKETRNNVGTFTDWQLIRTAFDLLMAGIDTVSITIGWSFMLLDMYPDIQKKVYEEIIDRIGNERMPTMADKVSLVYTQAVMDEILRFTSIVPLSDRHRIMTNANLKGFFIPAGTLIIPNLFACHFDTKTWEKPFEFYPEHFLLTDLNGELKYRAREELVPFGIGKRQCLGESLARMEIFIFFTSILQTFQVSVIYEKSAYDVFGGSGGLLRKPDAKEFIFTKRQ